MPQNLYMKFKQAGIKVLRALRLIIFAEWLRCHWHILKSKADNKNFLKDNPGFCVPPLKLLHEVFGRANYRLYYESGIQSANSLTMLFNKYSTIEKPGILEIGCGVGRIIRHLPELMPGSEIYGTDINYEMINWCRTNLKKIEFYVNDIQPPLLFHDNNFDIVFTASVLTHLSEKMQKIWIDEIFRVLRTDGICLVTVHGDYYAELKLSRNELKHYYLGQLIVRNAKEGSRILTTFQNEKYMREHLFVNRQIIGHIFEPELQIAGSQDIWIVKK